MKTLSRLLLILTAGWLQTASAPAQGAGQPGYQLNERIEVNTTGAWDKARIIEVGTGAHAGEFKVTFDGWAASFDRWLRPIYFRKSTAPAGPPAARTPQALSAKYQLNERIEVNTLGSWDKATIIAVGTGEHQHEFKVRYDGYGSAFDRWLLPTYFRKLAGPAGSPATVAPPVTTSPPANVGAIPAATPATGNAVSPRPGKYNISAYGAVGLPPLFLGHIDLQAGGKYRISRTREGNYHGEGRYAFDAATGAVQWLSGPCKEDGWGGTFTAEREGKTHKIRLRGGTIATNSVD